MQFRLAEVADATSGDLEGLEGLEGDDVSVRGVTIDSRDVLPAQLFVPIVAERDGHDFIDAAMSAGASAHLTSVGGSSHPSVLVADTAKALADLGRVARNRLRGPVIGVTGSVGKTSVKDLLAAITSTQRRTAASVRSFNNELGVPLTLCNAADDTEVAIVEMGARGIGHIAELCAVARPTVAVVTRIAAVHTSEFDSIAEVAAAKGELVEALPDDGLAVLNGDDPAVAALAERTQAATLLYGTGRAISSERVEIGADLCARFDLVTPRGTVKVEVGAAGAHQVSNALAAAAVAHHLGIDLEHMADGLAAARLSPWRMEIVRAPGGALVINDAYNANPTSMRAAFDALADAPAKRRIAVLGFMAELGPTSQTQHREIGAEAAERGFQVIEVGVDYGAPVSVERAEEVIDAIGDIDDETAVLVKGSRVAGLEKVADALTAE